jgi:hypothetical protein
MQLVTIDQRTKLALLSFGGLKFYIDHLCHDW